METSGNHDKESQLPRTNSEEITATMQEDNEVISPINEIDEEESDNLYYLHDIVEQGNFLALRSQFLPFHASTLQNTSLQHGFKGNIMALETCLLEKDDMGCLPIHIAIIHQHFHCFQFLFDYSEPLAIAMLRFKCADLNTPIIHLILRVGSINPTFTTKVIMYLYDREQYNQLYNTNEDSSIISEDLQSVLVEKLRSSKDEEGNSIWHLCAMYDLEDCMMIFINVLNEKNEQEFSEESEIYRFLHKSNRVGYQPLHSAMKFQSSKVMHKLIHEHKVNFMTATAAGLTPGHIAAQVGYYDGVLALQNASELKGLDIQVTDSFGRTPMDIAINCEFHHLPFHGKIKKQNTEIDNRTTTKLYYHPDSTRHLPFAIHIRGKMEPPPPENPERVYTLVNPEVGILQSKEFKRDSIIWDNNIEKAEIIDVLRVHEYHYVQKLQNICGLLTSTSDGESDSDTEATIALDPDTALSAYSTEAALRAAGAVTKAVDDVVCGRATNAFCIVRPPGHHAGPVGKVTCPNEKEGSHGFCLLNNVAIGAAYARSQYKRSGIEKIAILDFDVHHGNGTEEIIRQVIPHTIDVQYTTPYGSGTTRIHEYKPWRNHEDADNIFFCSVHGYGHKGIETNDEMDQPVQRAWFYPGSGATSEAKELHEFTKPMIWNVGLGVGNTGHGSSSSSISRLKWRSVFRDQILTELVKFNPDIIFLSAGFDAHRKEDVNWGYLSLLEQDYEWLVQHIKTVANKCCHGRLISVLEGGYNFHGRMISPFARSVAAHTRALVNQSKEQWDSKYISMESKAEFAILNSYLHPIDTNKTQIKTKNHSDTNISMDDTENVNNSIETKQTVRSKRSRNDVNYIALAKKLDEENQIKRQTTGKDHKH